MARAPILFGTASWADKPLIESGRFYPPEAKNPEQRLRYYASRFPLVEVDATYYGLPQASTSALWVERTPDEFTFDVKAYSLFTEHPSPVGRLPREIQDLLPSGVKEKRTLYLKDTPPDVLDACWRAFVDGLFPLYEAGKLGVIVFQFPRWVFPSRATWASFEEIKERLGPYRVAVEFRNDAWMSPENRESTVSRLGDLDFTYICVDEPQGFQSSVPPVAVATTSLGFVRFHGRNRTTWEKQTRTSAERFDYWYRPDELAEWVPRFRQLAGETGSVHAIMNTNSANQGPGNLELLRDLLAEAGMVSAAA